MQKQSQKLLWKLVGSASPQMLLMLLLPSFTAAKRGAALHQIPLLQSAAFLHQTMQEHLCLLLLLSLPLLPLANLSSRYSNLILQQLL